MELSEIEFRTARNEKRLKRLEARAIFDYPQVTELRESPLSNYSFVTSATGRGQILKLSFWVIPTETVNIVITVNGASKTLSINSATVYFPLTEGENSITFYIHSGISGGQLILEKNNIK